MTIRAVVFDIGGVLEITLSLGITEEWEEKLGLKKGEIDRRCLEIWKAGSIGTISEQEVHRGLGETLGWDEQQVDAFMADIWREYLGTFVTGAQEVGIHAVRFIDNAQAIAAVDAVLWQHGLSAD